jgi:DNA-directed RNA polymerase specialized sigma24 family protein
LFHHRYSITVSRAKISVSGILFGYARDHSFSDSVILSEKEMAAAYRYEAMDDMSESAAIGLMSTQTEHLAYGEVLKALDSLSDHERFRLRLLERRRLVDTDFAEGDLLHAAICQAILGSKKCPRETSFVAFLAQSMRNIAHRRRRRLRSQVPIRGDGLEGGTGDDVGFDIKADRPDPEESIIEREDEEQAAAVLADLRKWLADDEQAQFVLLGWDDGMKGAALRDFVGVDQAGLDYIIKRIRRVAAKHYPMGWRL